MTRSLIDLTPASWPSSARAWMALAPTTSMTWRTLLRDMPRPSCCRPSPRSAASGSSGHATPFLEERAWHTLPP
eukprot:4083216-Pyramimonas_sp.AAC.1